MNEQVLLERIVEILGPTMGVSMARSSLKVYVNEIKIRFGSFDGSHLDKLVLRLQPGLKAFLGQEKAGMVTQEILKLGAKPGGRS